MVLLAYTALRTRPAKQNKRKQSKTAFVAALLNAVARALLF
jgi:hypothetical protein